MSDQNGPAPTATEFVAPQLHAAELSPTLPRIPAALATGAVALLGPGVGATFALVGALRRARPLHPRGVVASGTLRIDEHPGQSRPGRVVRTDATGIDVFDTRGDHPCTLRLSRAVGRPSGARDVAGLGIRLPGAGPDGADADLLFASTGLGPISRHFLAVRPRIEDGALSTLWPYRTRSGPSMLAVLPLTPLDESHPTGARFAVGHARSRGAWRRIGTLEVGAVVPDPPVRFDTVANPLAGARQYPWVEAARVPAYRGARAGWPQPSTRSMGR